MYRAELHKDPVNAMRMPMTEMVGTTRFPIRTRRTYAGFNVDSARRHPVVAYHHWQVMPMPIAKRLTSNTIAPMEAPGKSPENEVENGRSATNISVTRLIQMKVLSGTRTEWNCWCWLNQNAPRIRKART